MSQAPHGERLIRLVDGLETPVVQVWGWPGSGRSALLSSLLERKGARGVAPEDLAEEGGGDVVRRAVGEGVELMVCHGLPRGADPAEMLASLAQALPSGCRLVVATARRIATPEILWGLVTPRDLALTGEEVGILWRRVTGRRLEQEEAAHLARVSDGWYRVVRLAAESAPASLPADAGEIAAIPAVADFLGLRVLGALDDEERTELAAASSGGPRPPAPLAAYLAAWGKRAAELSGEGVEPVPAPRAGTPAASEDPASGPRFRLRLLGRPEVEREVEDGSWRRIRFSLRRSFRILAYVATAPDRRAAPEELTEAIWPEADPSAIEKNFHPTLSRLRRDLRVGAPAEETEAGLLVYRDGLYGLDPAARWWIDVEELERRTDEGRALVEAGRDAEAVEVLESAWRLYRGPFLEGVYDAWVVPRREAAQRRHLTLLADLGAADDRLDRLDEAADAYRALLADDPLQEPVHVALMRLYARQGRRDLVRRQYERLSRLLRIELGVEPLPETAEEYHRLMSERG